MYKNGKSSYQVKKEKLLKIKNKLLEWKQEGIEIYINRGNPKNINDPIIQPIDHLKDIWEIVKDE